MTRVVILRPEPGASETKSAAVDLGLEPVLMPLFEVKPLPWQAPEPSGFDALLLTSANAVRHGGEQLLELRGLKAYCVGQATADAARGAGLDIASVGKAGVERLLGSIDGDERLLHLAGEDRTNVDHPRQTVTVIPVYKAAELPPRQNLKQAEGAVVLVHSQRAGDRFARLADEGGLDRASIAIAAISDSAAEAAGKGWRQRDSAKAPEDSSLLELARCMCNTAER
jgi:uroporphyrinogen-III synthase